MAGFFFHVVFTRQQVFLCHFCRAALKKWDITFSLRAVYDGLLSILQSIDKLMSSTGTHWLDKASPTISLTGWRHFLLCCISCSRIVHAVFLHLEITFTCSQDIAGLRQQPGHQAKTYFRQTVKYIMELIRMKPQPKIRFSGTKPAKPFFPG